MNIHIRFVKVKKLINDIANKLGCSINKGGRPFLYLKVERIKYGIKRDGETAVVSGRGRLSV